MFWNKKKESEPKKCNHVFMKPETRSMTTGSQMYLVTNDGYDRKLIFSGEITIRAKIKQCVFCKKYKVDYDSMHYFNGRKRIGKYDSCRLITHNGVFYYEMLNESSGNLWISQE